MKYNFTFAGSSPALFCRKTGCEIYDFFNCICSQRHADKKTVNPVFVDAVSAVVRQFPGLHHVPASSADYLVADSISDQYVTFTVNASKEQIIEVMQFALSYAQDHDLVLAAGSCLYFPDKSMIRFFKAEESRFPPVENWEIE